MAKTLFAIMIVLIAVSSASAQSRPGQDVCGRDASRFCRAQLNDGDQAVLACLQQHRAKLSKACREMLAAHGR
jgi:DNA-binding ferritin-like protein (Dps family)